MNIFHLHFRLFVASFLFKFLILFLFHLEGLWSFSIDKRFLLQELHQPHKDSADRMEQPVNKCFFFWYFCTSLIFYSGSNIFSCPNACLMRSGLSTIHAIFIASMSIYFVVWSDFFTDQHLPGAFTIRSSPFSTFILGVSIL